MTFHKNIYGNHEVSIIGTVSYATRLDEYSDTVSYVGEAADGCAEDDHEWRIKKLDSTSGLVVTYAEGTSDFDKQWSERTEYTYS